MTRKKPVIIVGGGPAGSAAAIVLARNGVEVAVIDKEEFPRDKICGDALSLDVINQLPMITPGLDEKFDKLEKKKWSRGVSIISPGEHRVDIPFIYKSEEREGYICKRLDIDQLLHEEMLAQPNVEWIPNTTLKDVNREGDELVLETDKGDLFTPLVLGAGGNNCPIARKLARLEVSKDSYSAGLRQYYSNVKGFNSGSYIELYFLKDILPGYLWIFSLPNGEANVGIGMLSSALSRKKVKLKQFFSETLKHHPLFKERFAEAIPMEEPKGFGLNLGGPKRRISGNGFLLLGDAAGLIDPFSGEGIANALRSGRIAASHILNTLSNDGAFTATNNRQYDEELYRLVLPELQLSRKLQKLCKYPVLFDAVAKKANNSPAMKEFLTNALSQVDVKEELTRPGFYLKLLLNK